MATIKQRYFFSICHFILTVKLVLWTLINVRNGTLIISDSNNKHLLRPNAIVLRSLCLFGPAWISRVGVNRLEPADKPRHGCLHLATCNALLGQPDATVFRGLLWHDQFQRVLQCGAPVYDSSLSVGAVITSITRVYNTYNYSFHGFVNQLIAGGPHIVQPFSGWWFEPLWKIRKSIGMMTFPSHMGK